MRVLLRTQTYIGDHGGDDANEPLLHLEGQAARPEKALGALDEITRRRILQMLLHRTLSKTQFGKARRREIELQSIRVFLGFDIEIAPGRVERR